MHETKLILAAMLAVATGLPSASSALADETKAASLPRVVAPEGVELYFIAPADGEVVGQEFVVRFGLRGMGVAPAATQNNLTGHHHLLIDSENLPPANMPIPADAQHIHFGGGQTETVAQFGSRENIPCN